MRLPTETELQQGSRIIEKLSKQKSIPYVPPHIDDLQFWGQRYLNMDGPTCSDPYIWDNLMDFLADRVTYIIANVAEPVLKFQNGRDFCWYAFLFTHRDFFITDEDTNYLLYYSGESESMTFLGDASDWYSNQASKSFTRESLNSTREKWKKEQSSKFSQDWINKMEEESKSINSQEDGNQLERKGYF